MRPFPSHNKTCIARFLKSGSLSQMLTQQYYLNIRKCTVTCSRNILEVCVNIQYPTNRGVFGACANSRYQAVSPRLGIGQGTRLVAQQPYKSKHHACRYNRFAHGRYALRGSSGSTAIFCDLMKCTIWKA